MVEVDNPLVLASATPSGGRVPRLGRSDRRPSRRRRRQSSGRRRPRELRWSSRCQCAHCRRRRRWSRQRAAASGWDECLHAMLQREGRVYEQRKVHEQRKHERRGGSRSCAHRTRPTRNHRRFSRCPPAPSWAGATLGFPCRAFLVALSLSLEQLARRGRRSILTVKTSTLSLSTPQLCVRAHL